MNDISSKQDSEEASDKIDENMNNNDPTPVDELAQEIETLDVKADESPASATEYVKFSEEEPVAMSNETEYFQHEREYFNDPEPQQDYFRTKRSTSPFQYNKRQTGKKNVSSIMVGSGKKVEFNSSYNQVDDRFGAAKYNRPIGVPASHAFEHPDENDSTYSRDSEQNRTADGFFDLKFYSHPLW